MDLRLTPTEELALVKALQLQYLKDAEKLGAEEGFKINKKTLKDLIIGIKPMPVDEVLLTEGR